MSDNLAFTLVYYGSKSFFMRNTYILGTNVQFHTQISVLIICGGLKVCPLSSP